MESLRRNLWDSRSLEGMGSHRLALRTRVEALKPRLCRENLRHMEGIHFVESTFLVDRIHRNRIKMFAMSAARILYPMGMGLERMILEDSNSLAHNGMEETLREMRSRGNSNLLDME